MMENSAQTQLYDLLVTRDFEPEMKDSSGKDVTDPTEADMFTFDWKTENKNYGTVVVLVGENKNLTIFFGDNLGRSMEGDDKGDWYEFLQQMKQFSVRNNLLGFELQNINKLKYTMQGMAAIKEGLFEGYYGNKKYSYSDQPKQVKLVIKHDRNLDEGDKRYRNIESIFVETGDGERFKVPSRSLMHGKLIARHVSEGGNPYDAFGRHIGEVVAEMNILRKFVRASKNRQFDGPAGEMCETAVRHYNALKAKAKRMIGQRGYHQELESFDPAEISDTNQVTQSIREMFIEQTLDSRIEEALPILAKLNSNQNKMKEADEFESWANNMTEGTWATPDTPKAENDLRLLLSKPFPVGPNATYATEQLYDILGDDQLFDQLTELADENADADAGPLIRARLEELGIDIDLSADDVEAPAEPQDAATPPPPEDVPDPAAPPPEPTSEDLDTDGVMMVKPSNMSSESVERVIRLAQLLR
jgi:hypothetical protein